MSYTTTSSNNNNNPFTTPSTQAPPTSIPHMLHDYWSDDFAPLQAAGRLLLQALRDDEGPADLMRRVTSAGPHAYFMAHPTTWQHSHTVPLSRFLLEQRASATRHSLLGLLPEAQMAWMSVDDQLYVWSIESSSSSMMLEESAATLCSYQVASGQPIVSVGLVRPVPGAHVHVYC
jgi:hypothetical protein